MGLFSGLFGKKTKVNLTPQFSPALQGDLYFTKQLRDLTSRRLAGQDLGFGEDFLSKSTNPAIVGRQQRFREETVPTISNQASARGLGRSSIVMDQIGKAERNTNQDIDELVSKFFTLNEQQKKQDFGQSLDVSRYMQDQEADLLNNRAAASERQVGRNMDYANQKDQLSSAAGGRILSAVGSFVSPVLGGAMGGAFGGGASKAYPEANNFAKSFASGSPAQNILGADDSSLGGFDIQSLLQILQMGGGF